MKLPWQALLALTALSATAVHAAPPLGRPNLTAAKPLAACKLQTLAVKTPVPGELANAMIYSGRPVDDPLSNYERTALGDWPILAPAERTDPWLRLILLSRKRPIVVDLAVLVDGKSFREKRDAWLDDLVSTAKPTVVTSPKLDMKKASENKKSDAAQTKTGAKPPTSAPVKVGAAKDEKKDEKKKAYTGPTSAAQSRHVPSMRDRLADYLAKNETHVDRNELGWLIAAWGAGPGVVLLDPSVSWQRSALSPFETLLDRNGDGAFSREEIAGAEGLLKQADVDSNDVIDLNEMRRAINRPGFASAVGDYPLLVVLDANTDVPRLESTIATIYKSRSNVSDLQAQLADITLLVNLGTSETSVAGVSVVSLGSDLARLKNAASATTNVVTVDLDGDYVEFSAAQGSALETDSAATQIAIGAAFDGNPLLRLLDRDNDGRLTRRERQELSGLLASLDRDRDGTLGAGEVPVPIRFAVTLGPHVHELLAAPAPAARVTTAKSAAPATPAWFISMDKNHDGDLSRSEFLGTTEQFKQLDTNGDGLLGVAEALKLKAGK